MCSGSYFRLVEGPKAQVVVVVSDDGRCHAGDYLSHVAIADPEDFAHIKALFERIAEAGYESIKNQEAVRATGEGLVEIVSYRSRLFCTYGRSGDQLQTVIVLDAANRNQPKDPARALHLKMTLKGAWPE